MSGYNAYLCKNVFDFFLCFYGVILYHFVSVFRQQTYTECWGGLVFGGYRCADRHAHRYCTCRTGAEVNRTHLFWCTPVHCIYIQWGKKVFSQPPIVQVLPLKKMREACNFHHRYTSTMRDKIRKRKSRKLHCRIFFKNLFANYGGK